MIFGFALTVYCAWNLEYMPLSKLERKLWHVLGTLNATFLLMDIIKLGE